MWGPATLARFIATGAGLAGLGLVGGSYSRRSRSVLPRLICFVGLGPLPQLTPRNAGFAPLDAASVNARARVDAEHGKHRGQPLPALWCPGHRGAARRARLSLRRLRRPTLAAHRAQ